MDISNKVLAVLLIAAMFVSVGGAVLTLAMLGNLAGVLHLPGITGFGTAGVVNVSIQQTINLNVSQPYTNFGVGYVETGKATAKLFSMAGMCSNWTVVGGGCMPSALVIENIGNVNLSVSIVSDKNAFHFIGGGTAPSFMFYGIGPACSGTLQSSDAELREDGGLQNNTQNVCNEMKFLAGSNSLTIRTTLIIPYDAPVGNKTALLTFNASMA